MNKRVYIIKLFKCIVAIIITLTILVMVIKIDI